MGGQRGAGAKYCAPTFNSLSDSGVRRAIEAIEGIALRGWRRQGHASHTMPYFCGRRVFFGGADFFFAKRLFFRYGEGCVWRASRASVGVTAKDNGEACFPLDFGITPTIGRQPSHPHRSGFFCSFHATYAPKEGTFPIGIALQCTPSLTLPPSSLICLQKSNHGIHRKCFRCFKCFGCFRCFISLLDHKTAPFWSNSEQTRKTGTRPPPP